MIDLSFLTDEEQEAIMKVLQRDAELKKAEEERVRHLPEKVKDDVQLKNMSGQWFYEAKSKRHRDKIHGADIIRASMRRKPATLAEVSQSKSNKAKNSWVSNVNKEAFVPPELHGIVEHQEEEELKSSSSPNPETSLLDKQDRSVKAAVSTVKQRRNPFNSIVSSDDLNSGESESRQAILPQLSNTEILLPSKESQPKANLLNDETETSKKPSEEPTEESQKGTVKRPVPKARKLVHKVTNSVPQGEDFVPKPAKRTQGVNGICTLPRGILKRSSSSSSTDSEVRANQMLDVQSKNGLPTTTILEGEADRNSLMEEAEDSAQISLEKLKQVRFSSSIGKGEPLQSPQLHHRRETRASDLLKSNEVKTSESDANRSDSLENKQTSTVQSLETYSSALQVKTIDSLEEDMSASCPHGTNKSVSLVNQTLQTKTVTPKKLEIPEKTSTNILPKNKNGQNVDQTCENKSNEFLSRESVPLKNFTDEHLLSAETKTQELSDINSAGLQQGKPDLVEEQDAKIIFKPEKDADEIVEMADESVSKVLDWFERSSGTEDRKPESARSQGGELKEVNFTTRTVIPTEHSGTSVGGKMQVREESPFGKNKQLSAISPTTLISEDIQLIKERRRPKQSEENEEQNEKSLTELDYTRIETKESDEEIKQQNQINVLKHCEHKLPTQKCVLEKTITAKRRIREIRAFWEKRETIPGQGKKEVGIRANTSRGGALEGLKESNKIKPTALHLPYGLDDQSKGTLSAESRRAIQASKNEHQNSFEFGPGHTVKKTERPLPYEGKFNECTKLTKDSNLQSRVDVTSASPEIKDKDGKEAFKGKVAPFSQQKSSFQALSLKEKIDEKSKNQISSPSQFQSLRNFWDTGIKLQNSIDRGDVSSPNNTIQNNTFITYDRKSEEDKGRHNVSKQELSQQQTQASEKEKPEQLDSVVCKLPLGFLTLRGMNVTHTKNKDTVQPVKKPIIFQPQEKIGLQRHEGKECIDKNIVSSKEHPLRGSQRYSEQNLPREIIAYQPSELGVGMKTRDTVNNTAENNVDLTCQQDTGQSEDVSETIEKSLAPSKLNGLSPALEKLVKEASETPPLKPRHADSTGQRTAEMQAKNTKYEQDEESLQEISETVEKSVAPSKASSLSSSLEKLLKEASETPPPKPRRVDMTVQRTAEMEIKNIACEHDGESLQEVIETIEKSDAPAKVIGLSSALEKLLKEASEMPPPKPRHTVQRTAEVQAKNTKHQQDEESLREINETIQKSVVPSRASSLSSSLEKLLKEASETPPPKPRRVDGTVQRTAGLQVGNVTCHYNGELLQETGKPLETSALSEARNKVLDVNLQKVLKDVCETPASTLENMDKKMQGKIPASQSMCTPHQEEDHPKEIQETIEKTSFSNGEKFKEFSSSLEKLLQEASEASSPISNKLNKQEKFGNRVFPSQTETLVMTVSQPYDSALRSYHKQMKTAIESGVPEQNAKASVDDLAASKLLKINGAVIKKEQRNTPPMDVPPLQGETNTVIKPFKINEVGRKDESTSLNASEVNLQLKELLKLRRTSTPLKDESSSPQLEGAQFSLAFRHEDDEDDDGLNLGSRFSDENSDYYSGTGSSTRSEEELNPVLMALKRSADRKMPSKSLEDIPSATSNKGKINIPREELALSAEDGLEPDQHQERNENGAGISTVPSQPDKPFSNPEKVKGLSKSVPSFLQEESDDRETDTASESSYSFGRIKKSPSSLTNLSGSSGMASLSSVSGSLMSVYSGDFGSVDVKGNIQFAIDYVEQLNELHIFICQCKDLAVADVKRQRSDPYVKTYLLPEKYKLGKRKTSVKKKTFNPVYNEILRYKIERDLLKNQSLNISVWHNDTFGRNSFLGEVELDLGTWDWNDKSNKQINWFPLKPRTSAMAFELENRGEMKLALQYVPQPVGGKKILSTGEVHIWVKECHDLPLLRGNRLNSFIKCTILPDTSRKSRQKTRTVSKTTNPVFNHTMVYDGFRPEDLKEACVELTVWDHNKLVNHFLGGLRIGLGTGKSYGTTVDWMDSTSDESALWEKMIKSPNTWVEDTLPLRMLMVAKLTK
ncbi:synaptotagmin-like protein 2 isoform X2 [Numida meleagris]|uniref:synaptotagmin-like protein 2 isoform X2 n=1 Tax=Numida meleagris TaxID=8996 RepID=UPI000B3E0959|nr:synaptotagmin-like protein 2 isoform X2 [Numida meleagris]